MSQLAEIIADFLLRNRFIDEKEKSVYSYGFEVLLSVVLDTVILFAVGMLLGDLMTTLVFIVVFPIVRKRTGGYHAKTKIRCILVSNLLLCILVWFCAVMPEQARVVQILAGWIGSLFFFATVVLIAPVEHEQKLLSEEVRQINRRRAVWYGGILSSITVVCSMLFLRIANSLLGVGVELAILMIISKKGGWNYDVKEKTGSS